MRETIVQLLNKAYSPEMATTTAAKLEKVLQDYQESHPAIAKERQRFTERDVILITYGDMVWAEGEKPLATLGRFLAQQIGSGQDSMINTIHILPFYPYTSDDGFSVVDFLQVDPNLGEWEDIERLRESFRLMFDAVINHVSRESAWFKGFLRGESPYTDFFITIDPTADLSAVFRPRALPLLTAVDTASGRAHVWTTFSDDQIDLNYTSPELLLEIIRVLLTYVAHGATLIRLDAIGFMWKEIGTNCIHLPQAHALIQLMRLVLDKVAPQVALVTETNVPHKDNIAYFGDGHNEAQMVYNFSLPPLALHAFHTADATTLSRWASTLELPSDQATFFNFLASHDGIGVTPARGILSSTDIDQIARRVEALGGFVSYKTNSDGSESAYELNINFLDALGQPGTAEDEAAIIQRFLASQAIMLALRGVPGIYFHSLFGSRSWREGVIQSGQKRRINREKLPLARLEAELAAGFRQKVFEGYAKLLHVRTAERAFSPYGGQTVLNLHPAVFAVLREAGDSAVLCLHNVSATPRELQLPFGGTELLSGQEVAAANFVLDGYSVAWIKR